MKGFFVLLFLVLALSAGLLAGWILISLLTGKETQRKKMWVACGFGLLLAIGAVTVYYTALRVGRRSAIYPGSALPVDAPWEKFQFEFGEIRIPRAQSKEPIQAPVSFPATLRYLDEGAEVWNKKYKCIGCHVNGSYLLLRPALSEVAGTPPADTREFFLNSLGPFMNKKGELLLLTANRSAQVVWAAAGLAAWDAAVSGVLSPETDTTLRCMYRLQRENGEWLVPNCWPPLQSDPFQLATVAALATATAPGWLKTVKDPDLSRRIVLLKRYLSSTAPPHEYARVWLLWGSTRLPGLLEPEAQMTVLESIWARQHQDGGWALRDFAKPSEWGDGSRRAPLEAEPDRHAPASDAHMTGLAVCVLRDAGIPATDPKIRKAVGWLLASQRKSGRWWSSSLNGQTYHFLTYSATCFALTALWKCGQFPRQPGANALQLGRLTGLPDLRSFLCSERRKDSTRMRHNGSFRTLGEAQEALGGEDVQLESKMG